MGCDGGSIPRRDEMVKLKKKAEKAGREAELAAKWQHCALSGEKLKKPIVACDLGKLYNKECLLLALLDKPNLPEVAKHIRNLRDVVELQLTPNPAYKPTAMAMDEGTQDAEFVCPVSGLEMSGRHRFVFLRGCGCVLSERTLKEVPSDSCHRCGHGFSSENVVVLHGSEEEVESQRDAMEQRRLEAKLAKGKRKNEAASSSATNSSNGNSSCTPSTSSPEEDGPSPPAEKRLKASEDNPAALSSPLTNGCSAAKTTSVKAKKHTLPKGASKYSRQGCGSTSKGSSASTLGLGSTASSIVKKTTDELGAFKTAASDPNAREAYKSLFYSADKKRPREKTSNWVTFFPYH